MNESMLSYREAVKQVKNQLRTMLETEQEKRSALLNHEIDKLEALLQAQQAMVMKLETLEKKRVAAQEAAGFGGKTADELLEILPEEEKACFVPLLRELTETAQQLRELNAVSLDIADTELRLIGQFDEPAAGGRHGPYQMDGSVNRSVHHGSAFEEKI